MVNVGIYIFDDVELLDFAGPYEVFSVTKDLNNNDLFNVFTITQYGTTIRSVNGLSVNPDYSFDNHPEIQILVIPGGDGTKKEVDKKEVLHWINECFENIEIIFSVCSGARLLGKLGLLDGKESTTHHEVISELEVLAPFTKVNPLKRYVDCGKIMTAGGISAGIDLSLYIVEKLFGNSVKNKTVNYMEYGNWMNISQ